MNKKSWLRIVTITFLCALLTTSALASSPKAKKTVHRHPPVRYAQKATAHTAKPVASTHKKPVYTPKQAAYTHKQAVQDSATLRIGIREGRGRVAVTGPQGLGVYRGDMLWKKAAANVP
ncbi:MAG: stage II sporulation protein SpoIID, partial [Megasphaera elsdenii]|nr:stage II sporulation protein SpoIID [Megasphaera elsdenii]